MKKIILLYFFTAIGSFGAIGQSVTWSEDIACIVYTHCTHCHNTNNSLAAIPITNYYEAWSSRLAIKTDVENKKMPPYQPETEKTHYAHEKNLTQKEVDLIVAWVSQGSLSGDTTIAPHAPAHTPLTSRITSPDYSQRTPAYTIPNIIDFQSHCFVLPITYPVEKKISEIEILPANLSAVYSAFLYSDTSSIPINLDAADPGNGYENYSGTGSPTAKILYGWVNGNPLYHTPPGIALKLDANAHLILRVLYAEDAATKMDSTWVNIKFDTSTTSRYADIKTLLSNTGNLQNPPFIIEADSMKTFYEQCTIPVDISLLGISHWAHKLCTSLNCYAVSPANDTINLLQIEDHENVWSQGIYYFNQLIKIPAGSVLYSEAVYDNTDLNVNNPFSPPHTISAGTADTTEEMLFSFFYLPYQVNDENIIVDTITHLSHHLNCNSVHTVSGIQTLAANETDWTIFPNPTNNILNVAIKNELNAAQIKVLNVLGETILIQNTNNTTNTTFDLTGLQSGIYFVKVELENKFLTAKIIKQ